MQKKIILITGASSGIGYDTALKLARQGHIVYGAARRVELMTPLKENGVIPVHMDVTDSESMTHGVQTIIETEGRIDVLINNAGYGYLGAIETVPIVEARRQLEVNLFGLAQLTQIVLPFMRRQQSGRIINTSSIAGKAVIMFGGWYNVSKFAVEAFSDALRMEVKPFGIDVSIIEPGGIKTDWGMIAADNLQTSSQGSAYQDAGNKIACLLRTGYSSNLLTPPEKVAKAIIRAVNAKHPRTRYRLGAGSGLIMVMHSLLPARWWDSIMRSFTSFSCHP